MFQFSSTAREAFSGKTAELYNLKYQFHFLGIIPVMSLVDL